MSRPLVPVALVAFSLAASCIGRQDRTLRGAADAGEDASSDARVESEDAGVDASEDVEREIDVDDAVEDTSPAPPETGPPEDAGPSDGGQDVSETDVDSPPAPSPATGLADDEVLQRRYAPGRLPKSYEKSLDPPDCDTDDPEVMILSPGDNLESAFNREDKRIFCMTPGDYGDDYPDINASGTRDAPRWIRYYDPDGGEARHPWHMANPETLGADERVLLGGPYMRHAEWWRIQGIRWKRRWQVIESSHVVMDRMMVYRGEAHGSALKLRDVEDITIQNSVFGKIKLMGDDCNYGEHDHNGIGLNNGDDVHAVGNEIFDPWCGDGIQLVKAVDNSKGIVIQDNDIYATEEFEGQPVENAIDLKEGPAHTETGSLDDVAPEDWALVEGNHLWGQGMDMIFHWPSVSGVVVRNNVVWETDEFAWHISAKEEINFEHHVYDNVFYETDGGFKPRHIDDSLFARNVFIRARGQDTSWSWFADPKNNRVTRNVFIETDVGAPQIAEHGNVVEQNAYYASQPFDGSEPGRKTFESADAANHDDLTIEIEQITDPQSKTIPGAVPTRSSPHADWFFR